MGEPNVTCFFLCCKPLGSDMWSRSFLPMPRLTACLVCCVYLKALSRLVCFQVVCSPSLRCHDPPSAVAAVFASLPVRAAVSRDGQER